jgi:predicted RNase H-like HicB family nuclease
MKNLVIVIERAGDNYSAYAPEVPGCIATGPTEEQAEENMRTALEMHLVGMKEDGLPLDPSEVVVRRIQVGAA